MTARSNEEPWLAAGVPYQRKFASARAQREELTLNGQPCAALLCWPFVTGKGACSCDGKLAHVLQGACGRAINSALGRCAPDGPGACRGDSCRIAYHPTAEEVREALGGWWTRTRGEPAVFGTAASRARIGTTAAKGERSVASAGGGDGGGSNGSGGGGGGNGSGCGGGNGSGGGGSSAPKDGSSASSAARRTIPAGLIVERLRAHASDSVYISSYLPHTSPRLPTSPHLSAGQRPHLLLPRRGATAGDAARRTAPPPLPTSPHLSPDLCRRCCSTSGSAGSSACDRESRR